MRDFKQFLEFRERSRLRLIEQVETIRSAVEASGISEEEIRQMIDEEVAAYRKEKYGKPKHKGSLLETTSIR